jgi:2-amino-4-hydroxy-6-hydroxymethyldihydropteridine diphosphokinase
MATIFLSLGSNLGNRELNLAAARNAIGKEIGEIVSESSIHETKAVGFEGNCFYNQVIKVETVLLPENLLQKTQEIEKKMGRTRKTVTKNGMPVYTNRIIDIDILLYDELTMNTETLTIPHPEMAKRGFVMKLLGEIVIN